MPSEVLAVCSSVNRIQASPAPQTAGRRTSHRLAIIFRQFDVGQTSECAGKKTHFHLASARRKISSALLLRTRVRAVRRLLEESA